MPQPVFADAFYWIALARPRDPWHAAAMNWSAAHSTTPMVTTDEVLTEYLNGLATGGPEARRYVAETVHRIRSSPQVNVLPQTRAGFDAALALYEARLDKEYSLVDCRSMVALRTLGLSEVLTNDHHFTQEGFTILFP